MAGLEVGYAENILDSLTTGGYAYISAPFLQPVSADNTSYHKIIKESICINEIKKKFEKNVYEDIKEFVCDFRLMLFNCYRFNGCDSKLGKTAAKLESLFEQKLNQLPIYFRNKTSIEAILNDETNTLDTLDSTQQRRRNSERYLSSNMPIKRMIDEIEKFGTICNFATNFSDPINFISSQLKRWQEKRENLQLIRSFDSWFSSETSEADLFVLKHSSDFVELIQFLKIGYFALGIDQVIEKHMKNNNIFELLYENVQYMLLFPQTSELFRVIVPLITTNNRHRPSLLKSQTLQTYEQCNDMLRQRLHQIYQLYNQTFSSEATRDRTILKRFGILPQIFDVLGHGKQSFMERHQFQELSMIQKCSLLLSMCNMTLKLQDSVRTSIDRSIDDWSQHQMRVLGSHNNSQYVTFPNLGVVQSRYIFRMNLSTCSLEQSLADYHFELENSSSELNSVFNESCNSSNNGGKTRKIRLSKFKHVQVDNWKEDPNKYRLPEWYLEEKKKPTKKSRKQSNQSEKKLDSSQQQKVDEVEEEDTYDDDEEVAEEVQDEVKSNEVEDDVDVDPEVKVEDLNLDELELVGFNFESVDALESQMMALDKVDEILLGNIRPINEWWSNSASLLDGINKDLMGCKLKLRKEVSGCFNEAKKLEKLEENANKQEEYKLDEVMREEGLRRSSRNGGVKRRYMDMLYDDADEDNDGEEGGRRKFGRRNEDTERINTTSLSRAERYQSRQNNKENYMLDRLLGEESSGNVEMEVEDSRSNNSSVQQCNLTMKRKNGKSEELAVSNEHHRIGKKRPNGICIKTCVGEEETEINASTDQLEPPEINTTEAGDTCELPPVLSKEQSSSSSSSSSSNDNPLPSTRRVFRVKDCYFTDELLPVDVKSDGSLIALDPRSISPRSYDFARSMIHLYNTKISTTTTTTTTTDVVPPSSLS